MSYGLKSEWPNKPIKSLATPMEILALQWKVSTLRWNPSIYSNGNTKSLRWKITPHRKLLLTTTTLTPALIVENILPHILQTIWWGSV